jgi:predicted ferric reductase
MSAPSRQHDTLPPAIPFRSFTVVLLALVAGVAVALVMLPAWLPQLSASLLGPEPKAYWYLSRSSAFVAYVLLWISMVAGVSMTTRLARAWPGGPTAFDLHQHAGLLGLGFALFHALILMGDRYINYSVVQVLVPFASTSYRPLWVGLGQVGWYLLALVGMSFYARKWIGHRVWRLIHFLGFVVYALALLHGLASGTDSGATWARWLYWASAGSLLLLTIYRVLAARFLSKAARPARAPRTQTTLLEIKE